MTDDPKTSNATDIEVHGHQNVTITGDVGGNVTVTMGASELRTQELDYLADVVQRRRIYAEKYTPMSGVAEVAKEIASDPLPSVLVPPEFMLLRKRGGGLQAEVERVPVSDLRDAIRQHRRMVLLGEPGSGKTTTLWDFAYHHALEAQQNAAAPLPIFVPLSGYTGPEPALEYVKAQAGVLAPHLTALLQDGRIVLLLDALNEMPSVGYQERVHRIQALLNEFRQAQAAVTCRALDYVEVLDLPRLEIRPLAPLRQHVFVQNYLGLKEGEALFWQMAGQDLAEAWQVWHEVGGTWEDFWSTRTMPEAPRWRYSQHRRVWERVRDGQMPPLLALGQNPYMLFMMVQVYLVADGVLTHNRGELFAQFTNTLIERERHRAVAAHLWPGNDVLHSALARLAYAMQVTDTRETAVDPDWAVQHMVVDSCSPSWLLHLARRASLLELEAGRVRFVHQLIQEYFAAAALHERLSMGEDMHRYWPNGWSDPTGWEATCVLLAGILQDMTPLVKQLLSVNPPLAALCIGESGGERPVETTVHALQQRLVKLMTDPQVAIPQRNAAGVAINYLGDPRRGVGLRPDYLPDLDWVLVPEKDPKTGRREFIYGDDNESTRQQRTEPDFWITRYPITYVQFQTFLNAQDGFHNERWWQGLAASQEHRSRPGEQRFKYWNHPRERVSWYDAIAFCRWLMAKAKEQPSLLPVDLDRSRDWQINLPTEWQWEKAARGHDGRQYPWGGQDYMSGRANVNEAYTKVGPHYMQKTTAVGMYSHGVSAYGVADLSGNVWEWCLDESGSGNTEPTSDASRVLRGGSWDFFPDFAADSVRNGDVPANRFDRYGFRVCAVIRQE